MLNQQLLDYIKQQLAQSVARETINTNLLSQGWVQQDVNEAFSAAENQNATVPQAPQVFSIKQLMNPKKFILGLQNRFSWTLLFISLAIYVLQDVYVFQDILGFRTIPLSAFLVKIFSSLYAYVFKFLLVVLLAFLLNKANKGDIFYKILNLFFCAIMLNSILGVFILVIVPELVAMLFFFYGIVLIMKEKDTEFNKEDGGPIWRIYAISMGVGLLVGILSHLASGLSMQELLDDGPWQVVNYWIWLLGGGLILGIFCGLRGWLGIIGIGIGQILFFIYITVINPPGHVGSTAGIGLMFAIINTAFSLPGFAVGLGIRSAWMKNRLSSPTVSILEKNKATIVVIIGVLLLLGISGFFLFSKTKPSPKMNSAEKNKNDDSFVCGKDTVKDADNNSYKTVLVGNQCWMASNLKVGAQLATGSANPSDNGIIEKWCPAPDGTGRNVDNIRYAANCNTDGGLYSWDEMMQYVTVEGAQGICPIDWHIPTDAELYTLEDYLKDAGQICDAKRIRESESCSTAGTKLMSGGSSGLNFPLAGSRSLVGSLAYSSGDSYGDGVFFGRTDESASIWSSSEVGGNNWLSGGSDNAWHRSLSLGYDSISRYYVEKGYGFSVRCLKD